MAPYQKGRKFYGKFPTVGQYDNAVRQALKSSEVNQCESNRIADLAKQSLGLPTNTHFFPSQATTTGSVHL